MSSAETSDVDDCGKRSRRRHVPQLREMADGGGTIPLYDLKEGVESAWWRRKGRKRGTNGN